MSELEKQAKTTKEILHYYNYDCQNKTERLASLKQKWVPLETAHKLEESRDAWKSIAKDSQRILETEKIENYALKEKIAEANTLLGKFFRSNSMKNVTELDFLTLNSLGLVLKQTVSKK